MSRLPIRLRLTLAFSVVMAAVLAGTGLFLYLRVGLELDRTLDAELRARAARVSASLAARPGPPRLPSGGEDSDDAGAQILGAGGEVVASTKDWEDAAIGGAPLAQALHGPVMVDVRIEEDEAPARVLATPVRIGGLSEVLVVGTSLERRHQALASLLQQLLIGGPAALLLAALAGYGLAGAALRPVESMRREASSISASSPERRLPVPRSHDEVRALGETLNEMLERLEAALERERAFVANASHQLRTPLARLKAELELAAERGSPEDYPEVIDTARREADRLAQMAHDLLVIARAERGEELRRLPIDVGSLFARMLERFALPARAEGRSVAVGAGADLIVMGDELRLEHALANLVDNALRHGDGRVTLSARRSGDAVELHVCDEGSGFADDFLPRAFERFTRAGEGEGFGLGLAIVALIAGAHGGGAGAVNRPGGGADVFLSLPDVLAAASPRLPEASGRAAPASPAAVP